MKKGMEQTRKQEKQLNVFLKGKQVRQTSLVPKLTSEQNVLNEDYNINNEEDDEGIDDDDESDDEAIRLSPAAFNTPATAMRFLDEATYEPFYNDRLATTRTTISNPPMVIPPVAAKKAKPAILPALGTTTCARMAERPKPAKKYKSLLLNDAIQPPLPSRNLKQHLNTPNPEGYDPSNDEFSSQVRCLITINQN